MTHIKTLRRIIRDDTEHGVEYYRADQVDALLTEQAQPVAEAMKTVTKAMQDDHGYAWGWHCNIAMAFVDAGGDHYTANQGAARFMKLLANVEPAHELPSNPPPRQPEPLTDAQVIRGAEAVSEALRKIGMAVSDKDLNATELEQEIAEYVFTQMQEAAHSIKGEA